MSTRKGKRYTTSYKKKEHPRQDPYAMRRAPKGSTMCPTCGAVCANKRWVMAGMRGQELAASDHRQNLVCPACQKIRDDYPEGIVTLAWTKLKEFEPEIRGLIGNVEARALSVNPLERVMKIVRRRNEMEVHTTNDRLAQRIGRELVRAFKGRVAYSWAHRDMLIRVEWNGPEGAGKTTRKVKSR